MGTSSTKTTPQDNPTSTNNQQISTISSTSSNEVRQYENVNDRNNRMEFRKSLTYDDINLGRDYANELKENQIYALPINRDSMSDEMIYVSKPASAVNTGTPTNNSLYCSRKGKKVYESSYPTIST